MLPLARRLVVAALGVAACGETPPEPPSVEPQPPVLRRLTQAQYENAVADLFGADVFVPPDLEPDLRLDGLQSLGVSAAAVSPRGVERYEEAAYVIAEQVLADERRAGVLPCQPVAAGDTECVAQIARDLGRRAWRRPLTDAEVDAFVDLYTQAHAVEGDAIASLAYPIAGVLQAPDFLFRPEFGADDRRYTDWELASRLSFFLWNSIPDDALLDAAADGRLATRDGVDEQAVRMLADPRARRGLRAWATDLLHLDELDRLNKDPQTFVHMSDQVGPSAREETLRLFERIVFDEDTDFRDILTTRATEVDATLAAIYGVPAPDLEGFAAVEFPASSKRRGLLGQVSFLALNAHPTSTSATKRGKAILETLLCESTPAPPGDVDTSIPEPDPTQPTLRDRIGIHLEVAACAGCHERMDTVGLGLENYDGLGRWREEEAGAAIDVAGALDDIPFQDPEDLSWAVRQHPRFIPCMVDQITRHGLGRELAYEEREAKKWLVQRFQQSGYRLQPLLLDFVTSPLFLNVGEVE